MNNKKIIAAIAAITILMGLATGCVAKDSTISKEKTNFSRTDGKETVYLTKENADIKNISKTIEGFLNDTENKDFRTIRGDEGYNYLTAEFNNRLIKEKDYEQSAKSFREKETLSQLKSFKIENIEIAEKDSPKSCIAKVFSESQYIDFAFDNSKKTTETLKGIYQFKLRELKPGTWQISALDYKNDK